MENAQNLPPLSPAEQALMNQIWRMQPVKVSDLLESVNRERAEPIIRNTLQTQLKRLEAKGWIKREDSGSIRLYEANVPEQKGRNKILTELKNRLFGGSGVTLIRCLIEDGGLSEKEVRDLNSIIEKQSKGDASNDK